MPLAIGLMSGTSVDGIDAALVDISSRIRLLAWLIDPFPKKIRERILSVSQPGFGTSDEICRLNFELGELFAASAQKVCRKARVSMSRVSVIGSHGQTICHLGQQGTLQIAEPSIIAERTGITTVADFRPRDIAAGGFGAPLVPYFHFQMFGHPTKHRAVHNIGGISNLTSLPAGRNISKVIGFDTGPGNMVIDGLMREFTRGRKSHDEEGRMAARGIVSLKLLKELLNHPFILQQPPKTCGREEFGPAFVKKLLQKSRKLKMGDVDVIATATAWTAASIAQSYRQFVFGRSLPEEIIFGGGGVKNKTLMKMIKVEFSGIRISCFDDYGIPSDAAEAVCFALLAHETLQGRPTNIPTVTGAVHPVILGKIIPGRKRS